MSVAAAILIVVTMYTDTATNAVLPMVTMQEFSSMERCEAAVKMIELKMGGSKRQVRFSCVEK